MDHRLPQEGQDSMEFSSIKPAAIGTDKPSPINTNGEPGIDKNHNAIHVEGYYFKL